ncbi:MAG: MBL fold metallo-hydrolase [Candidatus Thermoplasmatota archaeon]|nr:MBL fold metallo-hydrolase [Candidatus Thermoplasmatota archaeon]
MPRPAALPDGEAYILDTHGFGIERYCGVFVLPSQQGTALIETGPSATTQAVLDGLASLDIPLDEVTDIIPTHIHLDHAGATWELLEACPNATAHIHTVGYPYVTDPEKVAKLLESVERAVGEARFPQYGTFEALPVERTHEVKPDTEIQAGGRTLELIDAPGHAPHQFAVHDPEHAICYVGDALGIRVPNGPVMMTTPPPAFDLHAWRDTFEVLEALEADWFALTHYGWVSAEDHLPQFREQQEAWVDTIRRHRDEGLSLEETIQVLCKRHDAAKAVYDEATFREEVRMNATGVWLWLKRQENA